MNAARRARQVLSFVWTHPANRGHRMRGILRAVRFQLRGRLGRPTLATVGEDGRMLVWLHDTAGAKALYANPPDWNEMCAWRRILRPDDLFVDVGSNVGGYALWAADAGARVIALEPNPAAATKLRSNVALNALPIVVRECALAAAPGRMWLTRDHGAMNHLVTAGREGDGPDVAGFDHVEVCTLDDVLGDRHAAGVKIDVEGAERLVLQGAVRALSERRIGVLQVEWNGMSRRVLGEGREPIVDLLTGHGYRLARPDADGVLRPASDHRPSERDIFAIAPTRPACGGAANPPVGAARSRFSQLARARR